MKVKAKGAVVAAIALTPAMSQANGFDRFVPPPMILFEDGNVIEGGIAHVSPSVTGTFNPSLLNPGLPNVTAPVPNIANSFNFTNLGIKHDVTDKLSLGLTFGNVAGQDGLYPTGNLAAGGAPYFFLSSAQSQFDVHKLDLLARYKFNDTWSVHGGLRLQRLSEGQNGTDGGLGVVGWGDDYDAGIILGAAYENPDYYTRVIVTYNSEIEHTAGRNSWTPPVPGVPGVPGAVPPALPDSVNVRTPEALTISVMQPVNHKFAVFGVFRHANWSDAQFSLNLPGGSEWVSTSYEDVQSYLLGFSYNVNEKLTFNAAATYQTGSEDASLFAPHNGISGIQLGLQYYLSDQVRLRASYGYRWMKDAAPANGALQFTDNSVQNFSLQLAYFY